MAVLIPKLSIRVSLYFNFKNNTFYSAKHVSKSSSSGATNIIKTVNILNLHVSEKTLQY